MTNPDQAIESAIVAAGANVAPRITPADIEASIDSEVYFTAQHGIEGAMAGLELHARHLVSGHHVGNLRFLTFCVLILRNGFTVTGDAHADSPENFNAESGRRIARENAIAKVWPLMGYALKDRLSAQ